MRELFNLGAVNKKTDITYSLRAQKSIEELQRLYDEYKSLYNEYQDWIDELNNAKVYALKVLDGVKKYINFLTNTPKEFDIDILTPEEDISFSDIQDTLSRSEEKMRKDKRSSVVSALALSISILLLPAASVITIPLASESAFSSKRHNKKIIATHMQTKTRSVAKESNIPNLIIPKDGDILSI